MKKTKVSRSAKTGKFVSEKFSKHHPATTIKQTVKKGCK